MSRPVALVVNRDAGLRARLQGLINSLGAEALGAITADEARTILARREIDLILAVPGELIAGSANLPGRPLAVALFPNAQDKLVTGATWLEHGAGDLLDLGAEDPTVLLTLRRCLAWAVRRRETVTNRETPAALNLGELVGRSRALETIRERLNRLVPLHETIWIEGENGVGKKWCARWLHSLSARPDAPFVVIEGVDLEDEARESRWLDPQIGAVGEGGTLYFSDPSGYSEQALTHLRRLMLRLTEIGANGPRVISGSTLALGTAVEDGRLPTALAQQLGAARLNLPPLRERPEDIGPLAQQFMQSIARVNQLDAQRLSAAALDQLEAYRWPGNVRELRHAIEHAAILADGLIDLPHLPRAVRESSVSETFQSQPSLAALQFREAKGEVVSAFEQSYLRALMERERGNVTAAARAAGMLRSALQRLLRKYEFKSSDFRQRSTARTGTSSDARRVD